MPSLHPANADASLFMTYRLTARPGVGEVQPVTTFCAAREGFK